ncbi:Uncharacterised protein [Vibrio cholerae]|nr:Uncharacterised protein [Vibrio cholerae]
MTTFGDKLGWLTVNINCFTRHGNAGRWLQRNISNNILPARDTA